MTPLELCIVRVWLQDLLEKSGGEILGAGTYQGQPPEADIEVRLPTGTCWITLRETTAAPEGAA
jgi:hypothetical protein